MCLGRPGFGDERKRYMQRAVCALRMFVFVPLTLATVPNWLSDVKPPKDLPVLLLVDICHTGEFCPVHETHHAMTEEILRSA